MAIQGSYATAALRLAAAVDPIYDYGKEALQLDTNTIYRVIRGGTGADCWELRYVLDDLTRSLPQSLLAFREVDANNDVGNIVANGGVLASDTTPILRGDGANYLEISWATGNTDPIALQFPLPFDFDGTQDVTVELFVYSGSTDAATFTVKSGWDGGAQVTDTADDTSTKSATPHKITATIDKADIPDTARNLTLALTPAAHATNAIQLTACNLLYERLRSA